MFMNKLFLSLALLVVAPSFVFASDASAPVDAKAKEIKDAVDKKAEADKKAVDALAQEAKDVAKKTTEAAKKAEADAKKALDDNKDDAQKPALAKAYEEAKIATKNAMKAERELNPSYLDKAFTFANKRVASVRGLIERNPLVAVATVVAFTAAVVEAVHYFADQELVVEEVQF